MISLACMGRFLRLGLISIYLCLPGAILTGTYAYWIETPQWYEDDPIGLSRMEIGGDDSVERRFLHGLPKSNYELKAFSDGVVLINQRQTRVFYYEWDGARLHTVFDHWAELGEPPPPNYADPGPRVASVRMGKEVLLITVSAHDDSHTRVIDRATGAELTRFPWLAYGAFDLEGESFLLSTADNGFVQKRVVGGAVVEEQRFALSAQISSISLLDAELGWALVERGETFEVVDLHKAEKTVLSTFPYQSSQGSFARRSLFHAPERYYFVRPTERRIDVYNGDLDLMGAVHVPGDFPLTDLVAANGRVFARLMVSEGSGVDRSQRLQLREIDVSDPGVFRWPLRRVAPIASSLPRSFDFPVSFVGIDHAGEDRSVLLLRDHIAVFNWSRGTFEAFYERPAIAVTTVVHFEGTDQFLLWNGGGVWTGGIQGSGELYLLDLETEEIRQWGQWANDPGQNTLYGMGLYALDGGRVVLTGSRGSGLPREHQWMQDGEVLERITGMDGRFVGYVRDDSGVVGIRWHRPNGDVERFVLSSDGKVEVTTEATDREGSFWVSPDGQFELLRKASGEGLFLSERETERQVDIALRVSASQTNHLIPVWTSKGLHMRIDREGVSVDFATLSVRYVAFPPAPTAPSSPGFDPSPPFDQVVGPLLIRGEELHWFRARSRSSASWVLDPSSLHDLDGRRSPFENFGGGRWKVEDWAHSAAFGAYTIGSAPWHFFEGFGFGYRFEEDPDWIYWPGTGWMWANAKAAPFLYHPVLGGLFRYRESTGTTAHFQHVDKGYWIDTQPGWIPQRLRNMVFHLYEGDEYQETHTFTTDNSIRVEWVDEEEAPRELEFSVLAERPGTDRVRLEITSPGTLLGYYDLHFDSPFGGEWEGELTVLDIHGVVVAQESGSGRFVVER